METQPTSLYERLGGIYSIATVTDDFIDRIMVDDLNVNPRVDEAHHRVLPPGFKYPVTEMVGEATGGPQRYTGRTIRLPSRPADYRGRMGSLHRRPQPEPRQVRGTAAGAVRVARHRPEHSRRHRG
jgi:truncated hemoglobin YjbI